jgi:hypothetical protein
MKKLLLTLLTMPTVASVLMPFVSHAAPAKPNTNTYKIEGSKLCVTQHSRQYCVKQVRPDAAKARQAEQLASTFEQGVEFTDAESDAAIKKFGCDCPACIRATKQINVFTGGKA